MTAKIAASGARPRLLLHSCCGPCSSSVLEYLGGLFAVTVCYDNPNIYPEAEYKKRLSEQKRLCEILNVPL
ncbi:MAG: epoxyqueuosine reductase QueH, partial [Clostridia bacterium]|nr:epoxyqueuosine reductase QueH [Clostridia bacterium]